MTRSDVVFPLFISPPCRIVCMHEMIFEINMFSHGEFILVHCLTHTLCQNTDRSSQEGTKLEDISCLPALTTFHPHARWNMALLSVT